MYERQPASGGGRLVRTPCGSRYVAGEKHARFDRWGRCLIVLLPVILHARSLDVASPMSSTLMAYRRRGGCVCRRCAC